MKRKTRTIAAGRRSRSITPRMDAEVVVIGAGIAGLAAAEALAKRNVDVLLVEGRERIGGRIWTVRPAGEPLPIELGAEFVHGPARSIVAITKASAIPLLDVRMSHWRFMRGALRESNDFEDVLARALQRTARLVHARGERSFARALGEARVREPARRLALDYIAGFQAAQPERISARALAGDDLGPEELRRVLFGYDAIVEALRERIPTSALRLRTIVRAIRWRRGHVQVTCDDSKGGARRVLNARRAIVTLPLGVLKRSTTSARAGVRFDPPLAEKEHALAHLEMGHVVKVCVRLRDALWHDRRVVRVASDGDAPRVGFLHASGASFPTWWTTHPISSPRITAWAGGPYADRLEQLSERARLARIPASLAQALGVSRASIARRVMQHWYHDWSADPFTRGAYSYPLVGGARAANELARSLDATLYFAGEATAAPPDNGTVHGALESGQRAAREVLAQRTSR